MLSTGRVHQIVQGKGSDCETEPRLPPNASHKSRFSPVLLTNWLWTGECRPSLRCDEFARVAHRTQEMVYLVYYSFVINGCNSGIAQWKRFIGQDMREGAPMISPGVPPPQYLQVFTNLIQCYLNPTFWGFLWKLH